MNGHSDSRPSQAVTALPIEFEALRPAPQLLPGESLDHYQALQAAIFQDIAPRSAIEWLLAIDSPNYLGRCNGIECCDTGF